MKKAEIIAKYGQEYYDRKVRSTWLWRQTKAGKESNIKASNKFQAKPENHEKVREWNRKAVAKHRAIHGRDYSKERVAKSLWKKNNPEKNSLSSCRYVHARRAGGPMPSQETMDMILKAQDGLCLDCNQPLKLTIGHAVPISKGGTNDFRNIIYQCQPCNSRQHNKIHNCVTLVWA
jgi:5-methylcytosine-specific restriction endonuclease McrA